MKIDNILVTGGTGFFGNHFVHYIINKHPRIKRLVIFSRDENKQYEMMRLFPVKKYPFMRYFIGDIRDKKRLLRALNGIDIVVHAAALKHVPSAEYNPTEYIKTNIYGAQNLIEACLDSNVKKVIALSTDKASSPINLYGATKLCSDKLFIAANQLTGSNKLSFSIVRYGNVMGSRGSVIPFFLNQKSKGFLTVTDKRMTRFNITLQEGVNFVLLCLKQMWGGEIFVPKIPSYRLIDLVKAISPNVKIKYIGIRPGEKLHEEMISNDEGPNTVEFKNYFSIIPNSDLIQWSKKKYLSNNRGGKILKSNFSYNSQNNKNFLNVSELRKLININLSDIQE